ncbi:hypothetical protein AB1N83_014297 [Pleurotus pulmonarius]
MALVLWIADRIYGINLLLAYVDDTFSYDDCKTLLFYEPYQQFFPAKQCRLLMLWDELGIPHEREKQLFGRHLVITGFDVDPRVMTVSLSPDARQALVDAIHDFIANAPRRRRTLREWQRILGWINWGLNVLPLAKPGLSSSYAKIRDKQVPNAPIYLNADVIHDLSWVAKHFKSSSGIHVMRALAWKPTDADLSIYCDAATSGSLAFWVPTRSLGFVAPLPEAPFAPASTIFFFEALAVLSALQWAASLTHRPKRLAIYSDSMNTVQIFDSMRADKPYNAILFAACDILIASNIDLRVYHIPGSENIVADALSRSLFHVAAHIMTLHLRPNARQPQRQAWPYDRLVRERAIALGHALEASSIETYTSHVQSYLSFCKIHDFPVEPTEDTLSFYAVYMSHHIDPKSVNSYLSGICNQLETFFPNVRRARNSRLVTRTIAGCRKRLGEGTKRRQPLMPEHVALLSEKFPPLSHDNKLFIALLLSGFHALHRLGELTHNDTKSKRSWRKTIMRCSVKVFTDSYSYFLPGHKGDRLFEGNTIVIAAREDEMDPAEPFKLYLRSRDSLFPLEPALWLRRDGSIPTRSWFLTHLRTHLPSTFAGQSMRSGGATFLAASGVPDDRIQAVGRWTSEAYKIYIRKNPVVLQALLHGRTLGATRDPSF